MLFSALWLGLPTLIVTARRTEGWQVVLLIVAGFAGAILFHRLAPTIGEANYCGHLDGRADGFSDTPPHVFRCTSLPFEIAGWLLAWWGAYGLMQWREGRAAA
jgi:hypothetical protein